MNYGSLGDLVGHDMDRQQQSYVTVIPVEFGRAGGNTDTDYGYTRTEYPEQTDNFPSRHYKRMSRYEELRFYNTSSDVEHELTYGSAKCQQPSSLHQSHTGNSSYELKQDSSRRLRLQQLDARASSHCYPAGTLTLGRRRITQPRSRDALDLSCRRSGTLDRALLMAERERSHNNQCVINKPHQQHKQNHTQQYQQRSQHYGYRMHQTPSHHTGTSSRYAPRKGYMTEQRTSCYDGQDYNDSNKEAQKNNGLEIKSQNQVRETQSDSSIQSNNMYRNSHKYTPSPAVFPPPPPSANRHPPANQILPPPVGYQNQPNCELTTNRRMITSNTGVYSANAQSSIAYPANQQPIKPYIANQQPSYGYSTNQQPSNAYTANQDPQKSYPTNQQAMGSYAANQQLPVKQAGPIPCKEARTVTPIRRTKKKAPPVEVCVFLMSQQAVRLQCDDGRDLTAAQLLQTVLEEEEIALPPVASQVFGIWMISPLLEIQLKPHHQPLVLRQIWPALVQKYSSADKESALKDEPLLSFQRSAFFPKRDEMRLKDMSIMELLYEEAKFNVLQGRYPCEANLCETLGSLQAKLELGAYDSDIHTPDFFKAHLDEYLPERLTKSTWSLSALVSTKSQPENRLVQNYKHIPASASRRKIIRKYLDFCWALPYYGSVFFDGQVERPSQGIFSALYRPDSPVLIAVNGTGINVIDKTEKELLLSLDYEEMAWDFAKPCQESLSDCLPCIFVQFAAKEYDNRVYHVMQIFSKQSALIDALIAWCVEETRKRLRLYGALEDNDDPGEGSDLGDLDHLTPLTAGSGQSTGEVNGVKQQTGYKLDRLTLATFTESGECIRKNGSWAFSK